MRGLWGIGESGLRSERGLDRVVSKHVDQIKDMGGGFDALRGDFVQLFHVCQDGIQLFGQPLLFFRTERQAGQLGHVFNLCRCDHNEFLSSGVRIDAGV